MKMLYVFSLMSPDHELPDLNYFVDFSNVFSTSLMSTYSEEVVASHKEY